MIEKLLNELKGKKFPAFQTILKWDIDGSLVNALEKAYSALLALEEELEIDHELLFPDIENNVITCKVNFHGNQGSYGFDPR